MIPKKDAPFVFGVYSQVNEQQAKEKAALRERRSRVKMRIQENLKMAAMVRGVGLLVKGCW